MGRSSILAWHHLHDLMQGTNCHLELSEMVRSKRTLKRLKKAQYQDSQRMYPVQVCQQSVRMESRPCSRSATAWSEKRVNITLRFKWEVSSE